MVPLLAKNKSEIHIRLDVLEYMYVKYDAYIFQISTQFSMHRLKHS